MESASVPRCVSQTLTRRPGYKEFDGRHLQLLEVKTPQSERCVAHPYSPQVFIVNGCHVKLGNATRQHNEMIKLPLVSQTADP